MVDLPKNDPQLIELWERYETLKHAMQSGVWAENQLGLNRETLKHVRVGINATMCENAALVTLLVDKGICTEEEIIRQFLKFMTLEVERFEKNLSARLGRPIKLGMKLEDDFKSMLDNYQRGG